MCEKLLSLFNQYLFVKNFTSKSPVNYNFPNFLMGENIEIDYLEMIEMVRREFRKEIDTIKKENTELKDELKLIKNNLEQQTKTNAELNESMRTITNNFQKQVDELKYTIDTQREIIATIQNDSEKFINDFSAVSTIIATDINMLILKNLQKEPQQFYQIYNILSKAAVENDDQTIDTAVSNGYTNVVRPDGMRIIHEAARKGNVSLVKKLISFGDIFQATDKSGKNIISWFSEAGSVEGVKYCLALGFSPSFEDSSRWTPLHYAAYHNKAELCEYLCQLPQVKKNSRTVDGRTPLGVAAALDCAEAKAVLERNGCIQ